ncbi:MAG: TRAP transporter large permease subunit [Burkholderiaceae bacterium]
MGRQLGNPVLLAIPPFILAGTLMSVSGIAASLLKLVDVFIGHVRGGLGVVATLSLRGDRRDLGQRADRRGRDRPLLIPETTKQGHPRGYATALVACRCRCSGC